HPRARLHRARRLTRQLPPGVKFRILAILLAIIPDLTPTPGCGYSPAMTTKPRLTMAQMEREFVSEESCKALLAKLRWPDGKVRCPRCQDDKKVYRAGNDFRWKCKACNPNGYRFSVLTGSVFENTNVPLRTWFKVAFLMVSSKKGISALQVHRMIDP